MKLLEINLFTKIVGCVEQPQYKSFYVKTEAIFPSETSKCSIRLHIVASQKKNLKIDLKCMERQN
jgi:hypothetical protein